MFNTKSKFYQLKSVRLLPADVYVWLILDCLLLFFRISNHRRFWNCAAFDAFRFRAFAFRLHGSRKWWLGYAQESGHQGFRTGRRQIFPRETGQHWFPGLSAPSLYPFYPKRNNPSVLILLPPIHVHSYVLHEPHFSSVDAVFLCR